MHIRFAPIVPIALTLLLTACAGYAPQQSLTQTQPPVVQTSVDEPSTEQMAELTDDESYELPSLADSMLAHGLSLVGTRYRPGGTSVQSGFDCSGFVGFLYKQELGIQLPRSTREMITLDAPKVARSDLEPGDIIFFNNRGRGRVSHAGIYLGDNQFIHSSSSRSGGVRVDSLADRYWNSSYMLAKRVLDEHQLPATSAGPQRR
ncbi:peptidase P60 [Pseudomonas sp. HAR-UPW-AIA-41]|jgi:murein DD-endopeptidase / murein LD-carboxypeptidase|uniref:C40 family peptidase n=1 Tax=Pseudomonas sp. HAR-UPW-AIA-41 TaxID=1985301 RepID=UPI000BB3582B|nr:C40 family peptidase [Pseudomonas sp. HAR-UPW-AIA-41]PAV49593.1 peptidase P60 [Pseudomonas sp. HAR-UPW-AIA-41]